MINSFFWVDITFWLYLASCTFYMLYGLFYKNETLGLLGTVTAILGAIINTLALVYRAYEAGHAPFANLYESMLLFTWATVIGYLIMEFKYKFRIIGTFIGYAAFAISFWISIMYLLKNGVEKKTGGGLKNFMIRFPDLNILDDLNYKSIAWG